MVENDYKSKVRAVWRELKPVLWFFVPFSPILLIIAAITVLRILGVFPDR